MIFDAIITDRSTASVRICFLSHLFAQAFRVAAAPGDDRVSLDPGLTDDLRRLLLQPLELLLCLVRIVQRFADRLLPALEGLEQRAPRELRQQRQQDEERQDRPDEKPGIGLDQWIVAHGDFKKEALGPGLSALGLPVLEPKAESLEPF
jgi:hypothetical protein